MTTLKSIHEFSNHIRVLALKAMNKTSPSTPAYKIARDRTIRPVDYMRCAEFEAILRDLEVDPQMDILDVSSPQWFSLCLAERYPKTMFHYINIIDTELDPYQNIANVLGLVNLKYHKGDVRDLEFINDTFDKVVSISVIEHVYPEADGDLRALLEIKRVLKPKGELLLTVPYKSKRNVVYVDGPVWERGERQRNFFAREYDKEMFEELIDRSAFAVRDAWFICERYGIFAVDYYEWGPGINSWFAKYHLQLRNLAERVFGKPLDEILARRYLSISKEIDSRVVNIATALVKA
jgi:SAM-dependent methyltransferase